MAFSSSRTLPGQLNASQRRASGDALESAFALGGKFIGEIHRQQRNIFAMLAQRRQRHRDNIQAVIEVLAEFTPLIACSRFLLVAAMTRALNGNRRLPPSRSNSRCCKTLSSLACSRGAISPISSRNSVPSSAA